MKRLQSLAAIAALVFVIGCASQQTTLYKTLASVQIATAGAYNGYLDLVIQGKVSTNSVPVVSRDYTIFLGVWNGAVQAASSGVQAPATAPVTAAAAVVVADINTAKKGTP